MKIAIDARGAVLHRGTGLGTYAYQLIRHLQLAGEDLRLFWPGEEHINLNITDESKFKLMEHYREFYWQEVFMPEMIMHEKLALLHVPQNGIGLPKVKVTKYVVTIHDLIPYVYPETTGKGYLKKFLTEMPSIIENTDHIITVSEWSKKDIINFFGVPEEKITVIYEAAEPQYKPEDKGESRRYITAKYKLTKPYILYVGGFSPRKNVSSLINAFGKVITEDPEIILCLPGRGDKEQESNELLVEALGLQNRIKFLGFVPNEDLPYLYSAAELFVYPSMYEGFGLPPLEAMACGCPVLCSNATCLPEIAGADGIYFNPYNTIEMAEKMLKILKDDDLRHKLSQRGIKHANKFSWQKTAQETSAVYRTILAR